MSFVLLFGGESMTIGLLFYFTAPDPLRPIEEKYVTEINGKRNSFISEEDAMLYLFDSGIKNFYRLTKELTEYKDPSKLPLYEFWHIENRVGYVLHEYELYVDENDEVKRRKAYSFRFVGFGRSCFAKTKEELEIKVRELINEYNNAPEEKGYHTYPYYTQYYREPKIEYRE